MKINDLKIRAKEAARNAFAPFSKFKVGCAIETQEGDVFIGCNIESKSLTFNICAERNAISNAIAGKGDVKVVRVVIYTPTKEAVPPCGVCRQLIFEFGESASIYSFCDTEDSLEMTIGELLPKAFDFDDQ